MPCHTGSIETIERMTGKKVHFYKVDLSHHAAVSKVFQKVAYETTLAFPAYSNACAHELMPSSYLQVDAVMVT